MSLEAKIQRLIQRADDRSKVSQKARRDRINLYAEGLKAKYRQTRYALSMLRDYTKRDSLPTDTTAADYFSLDDRVHFYSDSFWAYLIASLDVLAQIINQTDQLGIDERYVSFSGVVTSLTTNQPGTALTNSADKLKKSRYYKNALDYRNCCLHRRQIFVQITDVGVRATPGYSVTVPEREITYVICDNPLKMTPKIKQNRILVDYCKSCLAKLTSHIETIIDLLIP